MSATQLVGMPAQPATRVNVPPRVCGGILARRADGGDWRSRARRWGYRRLLRGFTAAMNGALRLTAWLPPKSANPPSGRLNILLTGNFHSDNWINAHLRPLAASERCDHIWIVSEYPVPSGPNWTRIAPPALLCRILGKVPARLLTFAWIAWRRKPDVIGAFHLLLNGLAAALLAGILGRRSMYFCVGGPAEVLGGGIWSENRLFSRLETADPVVERRLITAVNYFDLVITMGTRAAEFFHDRGVRSFFRVVSGGIDTERFKPADDTRGVDVVFVGRLARIKRVDVLLRALHIVASEFPGLRAEIVGDGPERAALEAMARDLRLSKNVVFAGACRDVPERLRRARVLALTSDSEGLALSVMEAMACGVPAVVSNVGDLGDLVRDGVNGFLVPPGEPEMFARRILELLTDSDTLTEFSHAARKDALRYSMTETTHRWDEILGTFAGARPCAE